MFVDYTDLNKMCPKDSHPLSIIDQLVDSTACHRLYSFINVAQGYYQIPMEKKNEEKTSFITHEGLYCYTIMPFGLKNTGAIYQRLMTMYCKTILERIWKSTWMTSLSKVKEKINMPKISSKYSTHWTDTRLNSIRTNVCSE